MGFNGYLQKKEQAQKLRKQGLSYSEILMQVPVSKDTISRWCREIILSPEQLERIVLRKKTGGLKGAFLGAKILQQRRKEATLSIYSKAKEELGTITDREQFIAGISLYAAEGTKTDRVCEFTNADPEMIRFMANWMRKFCGVDESKFRGSIWIHDDLDEKEAVRFWSKLTDIPSTQFFKTFIVKRKLKQQRKQLHRYGIFSLRYLDSALSRRIIGWIAGLLGDKWYNDRVRNLHLLK